MFRIKRQFIAIILIAGFILTVQLMNKRVDDITSETPTTLKEKVTSLLDIPRKKLGFILTAERIERELTNPMTETTPPYTNQWNGFFGPFVLVKYNNIQSYTRKDTTSLPITHLSKLKRVRVLKVDDEKIIHNEEPDQWVFIAKEDGSQIWGWVLKSQLIFPDQFNRITDTYIRTIRYQKGDITAVNTIHQNGYFQRKWTSFGDGLRLKGELDGWLYNYESIYWFKKSSPDKFIDFFHLDENETISHEQLYSQFPIQVQFIQE